MTFSLENKTVGKKMTLLSILMIISVFSVGAIGNWAISSLSKSIDDLAHRDIIAVREMTLVDMMHDGLRAVVFRAFIANDAKDSQEMKEVQSELNDFTDNINHSIAILDSLSLKPEIKKAITDVKPIVQDYVKQASHMVSLLTSDKKDEAMTSMEEFSKSFKDLEEKLETLGESIEDSSKTSTVTAEANERFFKMLGILSMILGMALGIICSVWIAKGILNPLRESIRGLFESSEQLIQVSQHMGSSAQNTSQQANTVSAAAEEISKGIQTVAAGMEEMEASIREIAKSSADAARVANNAVQAAETTNSCISKLGDSSAEIGKVIKVITSIAEQTNLLALNATIEAARAGEAGKGFAVVANEVKELAKETAKATEEISRKIGAIQSDTSGAVESIGEIGKIISQINDIQSTIASAVEEQTATTNEIGRTITEAAQGSSEIAHNITMVAELAKGSSNDAGQTQKLAGALPTMATRLRSMVDEQTRSAL